MDLVANVGPGLVGECRTVTLATAVAELAVDDSTKVTEICTVGPWTGDGCWGRDTGLSAIVAYWDKAVGHAEVGALEGVMSAADGCEA